MNVVMPVPVSRENSNICMRLAAPCVRGGCGCCTSCKWASGWGALGEPATVCEMHLVCGSLRS